jgi:catechol 2,3-dioxygenase-like lactoylglutathione lyase family enzyme
MSAWSIDRISAVTLAVRDMGRTAAFYQMLGLDVSYGGPKAPFTTFRVGDSALNLRHAPNSTGGRPDRMILRVRGVDALHGDVLEKGLAPTAVRDAEWGERYFEVPSPEGFVLSFAQVIGDDHG